MSFSMIKNLFRPKQKQESNKKVVIINKSSGGGFLGLGSKKTIQIKQNNNTISHNPQKKDLNSSFQYVQTIQIQEKNKNSYVTHQVQKNQKNLNGSFQFQQKKQQKSQMKVNNMNNPYVIDNPKFPLLQQQNQNYQNNHSLYPHINNNPYQIRNQNIENNPYLLNQNINNEKIQICLVQQNKFNNHHSKQQQQQKPINKQKNNNTLNQINQNQLCKICLEFQANMINLKCFHLSVCQKCSKILSEQCPICRSVGGKYQKVYKS